MERKKRKGIEYRVKRKGKEGNREERKGKNTEEKTEKKRKRKE